jgi:NADP-dependent 3-hydroxy acid dehydrogenase YdfG
MGGLLLVPGQTVYGASRAVVKLLTERLYAALLNTNVKVTLVDPGAIGTNQPCFRQLEFPAYQWC